MSVSTTVLASLMINRIKGPVNSLTGFYQRWIDIQVSLARVHEFLSAEETQKNVLLRVKASDDQDDASKVALRIRGNFSFGLNSSQKS